MSFSDVPAANGASKDEKGEFCRKLEPRDVTSMRENIAKEAQQLIEDINAKRRQDTKLIEDFKKSMELHVSYREVELYLKLGFLSSEEFSSTVLIIQSVRQLLLHIIPRKSYI